MASITIRNLDDEVKRRLRVQAAQHGCSMEQEARDILQGALCHGEREGEVAPSSGGEKGFGDRLHEALKPFRGVDQYILPRDSGREPPAFD